MNGSIEGFIRLFSENFWERKRFKSKEEVLAEAKKFETNHNALQQGKLRKDDTRSVPSRRLNVDFHFDPNKVETKATKIHFIREVKSNGKIEVLNEEIDIGEDYVSERVWVTVDVVEHSLKIFHKEINADKFKEIKMKTKYKIENL